MRADMTADHENHNDWTALLGLKNIRSGQCTEGIHLKINK